MKMKWLFIFLVLVCLSVASVYIFIPGQYDLAVARIVKVNSSSAFRSVNDTAAWRKWWPENGVDGYSYKAQGKAYPEMGVDLEGEQHIAGSISVLPLGGRDSTGLLWKGHFTGGSGPIGRLRKYWRDRKIENELGVVLDSLKAFLERPGDIYGMDVRISMSMDSVLIMTEITTKAYPTTKEIYDQINGMRTFMTKAGVREADPPMLHVVRANDSSYKSMIAIPMSSSLENTGPYNSRRFVPWKVMSGEVRGGVATGERAMTELQHFITDHQYTIMAIPFQSLVTDRDREPDSSRWVTRVIVPVP